MLKCKRISLIYEIHNVSAESRQQHKSLQAECAWPLLYIQAAGYDIYPRKTLGKNGRATCPLLAMNEANREIPILSIMTSRRQPKTLKPKHKQ
jgi:hypothetical protein